MELKIYIDLFFISLKTFDFICQKSHRFHYFIFIKIYLAFLRVSVFITFRTVFTGDKAHSCYFPITEDFSVQCNSYWKIRRFMLSKDFLNAPQCEKKTIIYTLWEKNCSVLYVFCRFLKFIKIILLCNISLTHFNNRNVYVI